MVRQERHVPKAYIDRIFENEQPPADDVPVVDGNSSEAGGTATAVMKKKDVLAFLKDDRAPKQTSMTKILAEIEGSIFSTTELIISQKDQLPEVVYDSRRGRQVLTIKSESSGLLGKRNVRKIAPQTDLYNVDHISVQEALQRYHEDEVRGGLPTEKTLQKGAGLIQQVKPWEHRDRSSQGGWFSKNEQRRRKKWGKPK